jgi:predicted nucleic acid-binding protein
LIFFAKIGRLDLLPRLYGPRIHVPRVVWAEVLPPHLSGGEEHALESFRTNVRLHAVRQRRRPPPGLSCADLAVVLLARRLHAELVLADDRKVRLLARGYGLQVRGTVGILLESVEVNLLATPVATRLLDALVATHGLQLRPVVYARARAWLVDRTR